MFLFLCSCVIIWTCTQGNGGSVRAVGSLPFPAEGGDVLMEMKDALTLMISFATLIVMILAFPKKK
ncbi:putative holin-like toxin [Paenibacillus aurantius]|uniref:putative holin-like toxin n=1 Tax=Paenibacillus aurantius TaxID=2918900 RepID=UPI00387F96E2